MLATEEGAKSRIPRWAKILIGFGMSLVIWGLNHRDSNVTSWGREIASGLLGLGGGLLAAMAMVILDEILETIRPKRNERVECGVLWSISHMTRLKEALNNRDPATELARIYAGSDSMKAFKSADIYQAIQDMHDGAFLATVHLWGRSTYDEGIMRRGDPQQMTNLQRSIRNYRDRVTKAIDNKKLLAARRYRVNAPDVAGFVGAAMGTNKLRLIASLLELAYHVSHDRNSGWQIDVEFHRGSDFHNPCLDYALLFGAREKARLFRAPPEHAGEAMIPRVAFITHSREKIEEEQDYVGVAIADPALVAQLMEDRTCADPSIAKGDAFVTEVIGFSFTQLNSLKDDPALSAVAEAIGKGVDLLTPFSINPLQTPEQVKEALNKTCDAVGMAIDQLS